MTKIKLNKAGVRALLNDPGIQSDMNRRAERIAAAAGPGMIARPSPNGRARAVVITSDTEAMLAEAKDKALTRAIDAGR